MEHWSQIILAIIASLTTIITIILQRKQDSITTKINKSGDVLKHKKDIEQQIALIELKRRSVIDDALLLILDTNLAILINRGNSISDSVKQNTERVHKTLEELSNKTSELEKRYSVIMDLSKSK